MATRSTLRLSPQDRVVVLLGAGATKACGGPSTSEILPLAFASSRRSRLKNLDDFLIRHFGVPAIKRADIDFPQLPLLLSLLDTAIDREHGFGGEWAVDKLRLVRQEAEYAVFSAIADALKQSRSSGRNAHEQLFQWIWQKTGKEPVVISLNYDLLADQALIAVEGVGGFPDYGCQIDTAGYSDAPRWGKLLKIHGSMNWIYCSACDRLEVGIDKRGETFKIALRLARTMAEGSHDLQDIYQASTPNRPGPRITHCPTCDSDFRPVMITPTHMKDYRNPHIAALWYRAERELQACTRVIFVGYSLPWDDVDIIYLLKRGLLRKRRTSVPITVVDHSRRRVKIEAHEAGARYRAVFGREIDWQPIGFEKWVQQVAAH